MKRRDTKYYGQLRTGSTKPLKGVLDELIKVMGIDKPILQQRALQIWDDVVGEQNARHTRPVKMEGSVMWIEVLSAPWRQELYLLKFDLMEKLNSRLGQHIVNDIHFL